MDQANRPALAEAEAALAAFNSAPPNQHQLRSGIIPFTSTSTLQPTHANLRSDITLLEHHYYNLSASSYPLRNRKDADQVRLEHASIAMFE